MKPSLRHVVFSASVAGLLSGAAPAAEPPNLVANGDFKQATDGRPDRWEAAGDAKDVTQTLRVATDADGAPYARLECTRCEHRSPSSHAMLALVGGVLLAKGRMYELSCRMRSEGLKGGSVSIALSDTKTWTNAGLYASLPVGTAWKAHRRVFTATQDFGATGRLQIWYAEPGTLCVADVRIAEIALQDVEFTDLAPPSETKNLVFNGSFEVGASGWSSLGTGTGWGDLARLHGKVTWGDGTHGSGFLRIPLGPRKTPELFFDYYEPVARMETRPRAASRGWIRVEPGVPYTLSCDMRSNPGDVPAVIGVHEEDPAGGADERRLPVRLTPQWKRHALTFRPAHRYLFVYAGPDLSKSESTDVDIDAVQLEKGESATAFQPAQAVEVGVEFRSVFGLSTSPGRDGRTAGPSWVRKGPVFVAGDSVLLVARLRNNSGAPKEVHLSCRVTDYENISTTLPVSTAVHGASVTRRSNERQTPERKVLDGNLLIQPDMTLENEFSIPSIETGYWNARVMTESGGKTYESGDVRAAVVPVAPARDSSLGINHAFVSADLIREAADAGVTWYRDWSLKWQHLEPEKGQYRWEIGDAQIDRVLRENMRVLPLLPPFPSADWSSEAPAALPTKGYPGVRLKQAFAPKDPALLADFIGKAVDRYKDRIHIWEFLNEPVYTDYSLPRSLGSKYGGRDYAPADYVALLKTAAAAMKKADPDCKVIGGFGGGPETLTKEGIEAGLLDAIDILNLHIYPGARQPEGYLAEMDQLLALMDAKGKRRPIWMTEFSYYAADDLPRKPFVPSPSDWAEERLLESEKQCAEYTVRFFTVMMSRGVEKIFLHSGASSRVNRPSYECALFAEGGAPRKLFPALAVFTSLLGARATFAGERRLGPSGYAMAFEAGSRAVVVLWVDDPAATAAAGVPAADGVTWQDIMGRPVTAAPVPLSTSPIYLVGPAGRAKRLLDSVTVASGGR